MINGIFERNKEQIIKWYVKDRLSGVKIQKRLKTKNKKVYNYLRKWGVKIRTKREAHIGIKQTKESIEKMKNTKKERGSFNPFSFFWKINAEKRRGKTYEELYGKEKAKKIKEKQSKKGRKGWKHTPQQKLEHSKRMKGKFSGEKNYFWRGGISKLPYPFVFGKELKLKIRKRDNFTCQECKRGEEELKYKLHIHHIDFNKNNCYEENLISLCRNCHGKTSYNKKDWTKYYQLKMGRMLKCQ